MRPGGHEKFKYLLNMYKFVAILLMICFLLDDDDDDEEEREREGERDRERSDHTKYLPSNRKMQDW